MKGWRRKVLEEREWFVSNIWQKQTKTTVYSKPKKADQTAGHGLWWKIKQTNKK